MKTLGRASDKAELVARLRTLRPETARVWGRMSVHQMVCHVGDSFRMCLGEQAVTPRSGPIQRTLLKWVVLYVPLPWPAGITTSPELDQARGAGTCPSDFAADVARVEVLMDASTTRDVRFEWPLHPIFGRMSAAAWLRWAWLHTDHHLRQFGA